MYVTAQVLDINWKVVASVSDKWQKEATKTLRAQWAGQSLAKMLIDKWVKSAAFDRNWYLYHGRVKAFAQWLRDGWFAI
jgi:large subunit ribosomal protein L18